MENTEYQVKDPMEKLGNIAKFIGKSVMRKGSKAIKQLVWGLLGPVIIPAIAILVLGGLITLVFGSVMSAGSIPEFRNYQDEYTEIASAVQPWPQSDNNIEGEFQLGWGILKSVDFIMNGNLSEPPSASVPMLATRLRPEFEYKTYSVDVFKEDLEGQVICETLEFNLVDKVITYNEVVTFDYSFTVEGTEVDIRQSMSRLLDRSKLENALLDYEGVSIDPVTLQILEQSAISFERGEANYDWLMSLNEIDVGSNPGWPVAGQITSAYGYRYHPISGRYQFHSGVDIAAVTGTPIPAVREGKVVYAGNQGGYGLCVILDHGGGLVTLYAHCSRIHVLTGENVKANQIIADIGSTGYSTGPHLHFEVRIDGATVDPFSIY